MVKKTTIIINVLAIAICSVFLTAGVIQHNKVAIIPMSIMLLVNFTLFLINLKRL